MVVDKSVRLRRERLAASWLVAAVSTLVAALGHVIAGGAPPSFVAIAGAALLSGWLGMLVVGRRLTRVRTGAGVAVDQLIFHLLFSFFGIAPTHAVTPDSMTHHGHGAPLGVATVDPAAGSAALDSAAMVLNHSLAAVVAYLLLRVGVTAVARCLHSVLAAIRRVFTVPGAAIAAARPLSLTPRVERIAPTRQGLFRLPDRRGPPQVRLAL